MKTAFLALLLAVPAAADPAAMTATLEALSSQAAVDPSAIGSRENAKAQSGKGFEGFTVATLTPVEYVPLDGARRSPPPVIDEKPPVRDRTPAATEPKPVKDPASVSDGSGVDYYFEGKTPVNGITIYTPKKGDGSTTAGDAPTAKYGAYGKYAMIGGVALIGAGLLLGGWPLVALGVVGGILIGAGAVLSFLFGGKKK